MSTIDQGKSASQRPTSMILTTEPRRHLLCIHMTLDIREISHDF